MEDALRETGEKGKRGHRADWADLSSNICWVENGSVMIYWKYCRFSFLMQ